MECVPLRVIVVGGVWQIAKSLTLGHHKKLVLSQTRLQIRCSWSSDVDLSCHSEKKVRKLRAELLVLWDILDDAFVGDLGCSWRLDLNFWRRKLAVKIGMVLLVRIGMRIRVQFVSIAVFLQIDLFSRILLLNQE